jgi:hypothetical protein
MAARSASLSSQPHRKFSPLQKLLPNQLRDQPMTLGRKVHRIVEEIESGRGSLSASSASCKSTGFVDRIKGFGYRAAILPDYAFSLSIREPASL